MARKVFISFLGTGNYVETSYVIGDVQSQPVRFVQEALIDSLCSGWSEDDRIYIFYTEASYKTNWLDNGQQKPIEEIDKTGLESRLKVKKVFPLVEGVKIKEGFSEEEIWDIFDTVYGKLKEEDEIYFDVTHAFRSIPLFSTVLFNYSQFMKGTSIKSIHYGAFEKLGPAFEVRKLPLEKRVAPVLDLTSIVKLQKYTEMANNMVSFGRVGQIADAIQDGNDQVFVKYVCNAVNSLDQAIIGNRLLEIREGKYKRQLDNYKEGIKKLNLVAPINEAVNRLFESLEDFSPQPSFSNIAAAIEWAYKYDMLAQAYTLGREYILTLCAEYYKDYSPFGTDRNGRISFREFISSLLSIKKEDIDSDNYKGLLAEHKELCLKFLQSNSFMELRSVYPGFANNRNSINHAKGDKSFTTLKSEFREKYDKCINILNSLNVDKLK